MKHSSLFPHFCFSLVHTVVFIYKRFNDPNIFIPTIKSSNMFSEGLQFCFVLVILLSFQCKCAQFLLHYFVYKLLASVINRKNEYITPYRHILCATLLSRTNPTKFRMQLLALTTKITVKWNGARLCVFTSVIYMNVVWMS